MKTVICSAEEIRATVQMRIDALPADAVIGLAYGEDTAGFRFGSRRVLQIMDTESGLLRAAAHFDGMVEDYDGERIDFLILGLGRKAQIGFNEIGAGFDSGLHRQKLTKSTKEDYAFLGEVPDFGMTLGIRDIVRAEEIVVIATGEKRADAVFSMLYARNDGTVPAAFLQIPPKVTVYADPAAASRL